MAKLENRGQTTISEQNSGLSPIFDTLRLMVGIGSYQKYVQHMQRHHRDAAVMSETEYFRYCQEARYPSSKNRDVKRCPC